MHQNALYKQCKIRLSGNLVVSSAHVRPGGPATALPTSLYEWTQQTAELKLAVLIHTSQLAYALAGSFGSGIFLVGLPDGQVHETHLASISGLNSEFDRVMKSSLMNWGKVKCLPCQAQCKSGEEVIATVEVTSKRHYQTLNFEFHFPLSLRCIYLSVNKLNIFFHQLFHLNPSGVSAPLHKNSLFTVTFTY